MSGLPLTLLRRVRGARHRLDETQRHLEESRLGRLLISTFLAVTLAAVAVTNLPDSKLKSRLLGPGGPYLMATGLDQNWGMFAPDGRRSVIFLVARVRYTDGSTAAWRLPEAGPFLGTYWDYRWRKWAEWMMTMGVEGAPIRRAAAIWIAREMQRPGRRPALVTLGTRYYDLLPPGSPHGDRGPWRESVLYQLSFR